LVGLLWAWCGMTEQSYLLMRLPFQFF